MLGCDSEDRGTGRTTFASGGSVTHGNVKCPSVEAEGAPVIKSWYFNFVVKRDNKKGSGVWEWHPDGGLERTVSGGGSLLKGDAAVS
jgi:hypothetical protein